MTTHAGDALSAMLDGELPADEEASVREHLAGCAACSAELDSIQEVRALVRLLPAAEPPFGFLERVAHSHQIAATSSRRRLGVAALAAMAAASVGLLFLSSPSEQPVSPQIVRLVEAHATSSSGDPISQLTPVAVPVSFGP